MYHTIQTLLKEQLVDTVGENIRQKCKDQLQTDTGKILTSTLYTFNHTLSEKELSDFAQDCLQNKITQHLFIDEIYDNPKYQSLIAIAQLPGVTDDLATSAQTALADYLNKNFDTGQIFTQKIYYFEHKTDKKKLLEIAKTFLGNPLIHHIEILHKKENQFSFVPYVPEVELTVNETVEEVNLNISDADLERLSAERVLALNLEEIHAVKTYFSKAKNDSKRKQKQLPLQPTDVELEIIAQTWSEHCKHKEFNALITYTDKESGKKKTINSLFKTYIKGSTDRINQQLKAKDNHWLVKVFSDNAGVVRINKDKLFVWKVETHNSPSALDPYGGAITGILGVNRDIMGTGIGGAELMFNTNVLCFGSPNYDRPLQKGQLHPKRIMEGVISGIEDGGNKSGIPTIDGAVVFDDRFAGKPLVFCGTGGIMPDNYSGRDSWEKTISLGDRIIMAGGRVGKDGIHGATFSSTEINEKSPQSAVQIGSPITQKKLSDFMIVAARKGLIKSSTDNGAGGLSSSVGELAEITNGVEIYLDKVPLKYSGLKPWEIFVSESQERMTLVIEPRHLEETFALAEEMEVEVTDIGKFTDSGYLDIQFKDRCVAYLDLNFLHNGLPQKKMEALYEKVPLNEPEEIKPADHNQILQQLLSSLNICSRENIIRRYDHEVKGLSVIKSLMGKSRTAPQDAAVMRIDYETDEGIAVSNGIMPKFGDIDPYAMSCGAFDEAVRQIIAVGGSLPNLKENDDVFWTVNDNFCVPDSDFHPEKNPDGKQKLAKLVNMCEALYDMATFFDIPMTSGKDSMKNDFKTEQEKISVPPTILYSMAAKIKDVKQTLTADFKKSGDLIYQLGVTYNELGASEFYNLFGKLGANVPQVRKSDAKNLYIKMSQATQKQLLHSAHDLSDGGLATALAESLFGTNLGAEVDLSVFENLTTEAKLYSESHSRFVVSISPENKQEFEKIFGNFAFYLGKLNDSGNLSIKENSRTIIEMSVDQLEKSAQSTLI